MKSQGLCETTHTERFEAKNCTCPTYAGNLGPCVGHHEGANGRCVYCDHELSCTPDGFKADCEHEAFRIEAKTDRVLKNPEDAKAAYWGFEIKAICMECGKPFEWQGLPYGYSAYRPTVSIDNRTLRIAALPNGKELPKGLAGYNVSFMEAGPEGEVTKQ